MTRYVLLDDQKTGITRYFSEPLDVITAFKKNDIADAFELIEKHRQSGRYLAGFFAYELGYLLEPSLEARLKSSDSPLLQIGVFKDPPKPAPAELLYRAEPIDLTLAPDWTLDDYKKRFEIVKKFIELGHVYQTNLTFPMRGQTHYSAAELYAGLRRRQPGRYGGIVQLGAAQIVSFSPELFFEKTDELMRMRPMKGTRRRLDDDASDKASLKEMQAEPKSMAENLMIVDLLRNDLSRLCQPGSVNVPELFSLETYPTLHQMTSQVEGRLSGHQSWHDIFKGLFPCGSVTGAPKIRAMELIAELEDPARGAYCGAIGYITPENNACFNVAIRTLQLDNGKVRYDVGSGVVLDSEAEDEYRECLLKSNILKTSSRLAFETFGWHPEKGYKRRKQHIKRLLKAAKAHSLQLSKKDIEDLLKMKAPKSDTPQRIRLSLSKNGGLSFSVAPLTAPFEEPLRVCISRYPLNEAYQQTPHKVEKRDFYDGERARLKALYDIDEVLFLDDSDRLCEGSFTSVFVDLGDGLLTPSLPGLLPGILRAKLVKSGSAKETDISLADLAKAQSINVGNSLRGLMRAELISLERL